MPPKSNLTYELMTQIAHAPAAAGSSDITDSNVIDMANYEGVRFIVGFGAITSGAVTGVKAKQGQAASSATALTSGADLLGTAVTVADDGDSKLYILDIYRPQERYVQLVINRATQNAVLDFAIAEKYAPRKMPVTKHADVAVQEMHVSPAEGTA